MPFAVWKTKWCLIINESIYSNDVKSWHLNVFLNSLRMGQEKASRKNNLFLDLWWKKVRLGISFLFFKYIFLMFIFDGERERKRQSTSGEGIDREGDRVRSRLQALICQHRAQHRAQTHEPWDHYLSQSQVLNRLSHPGTPGIYFQVRLMCHTSLMYNLI